MEEESDVGQKIIKDTLRNILEEYREKRPNLSLRSIAKKSGVNRYFLNKVLDKDDHTGIDLNQLLLFCRFISSADTVQDTIKVQIKSIQEYIFNYLDIDSETRYYRSNEIDLYDKNTFFTMLLACCDSGFTKQQMVELLGEQASETIDDLITNKSISQDENGRLSLAKGEYLFFHPMVIRFHLNDLVRYYTLKHQGQMRNHISLYMQGFNEEGLQKSFSIHKEYARQLQKLVMDEQYWGNNPTFLVSCFDTFNDKLR